MLYIQIYISPHELKSFVGFFIVIKNILWTVALRKLKCKTRRLKPGLISDSIVFLKTEIRGMQSSIKKTKSP